MKDFLKRNASRVAVVAIYLAVMFGGIVMAIIS